MNAPRQLRVLISHECSGMSRRAWRALGHEAWSCDLLPAADGEKEFHLMDDGISCIRRGHPITGEPWDFVITHFVCRYLANSGSLRLYKGGKKVNGLDLDRWAKMRDAAFEFRRQFFIGEYRGPLCAENPIMHGHATQIISPEEIPGLCRQVVQPWQFGDDASKATVLWLRGLPKLTIPPKSQWCPPRMVMAGRPRWANQTPSGQNKLGPSAHRAATRAITYPGIAKAMAEQWSEFILNQSKP